MDITKNIREDIEVPSLLQPPDTSECDKGDCPNCAMLIDQLKKLSYCLAVAQRLASMETI